MVTDQLTPEAVEVDIQKISVDVIKLLQTNSQTHAVESERLKWMAEGAAYLHEQIRKAATPPPPAGKTTMNPTITGLDLPPEAKVVSVTEFDRG